MPPAGTIVGTVPLSDRYIALLLWLNTVVHELGIPLPLTPTALLAGAQVSEGRANALTLVLVITAGTLMGNSVWFAAGRLFGSRVLKALCKISLSPDTCVGRTELAFTKWGRWSMVFGHFIPGISLVAPPLAGALGIRWPVFLGLTAIGGALYGGVLIGVGMILSDGILSLADTVLTHGLQSAGIVLVACAAYLAWRWWRRHLAARTLQVPRISAAELRQALQGTPSPIVVDVRGEATRLADLRLVPGAVATTISQIVQVLAAHPKSAPIVVYCACPNDASAAQAVRVLREAGYTQARALRGGLDAWLSEEDARSG
jgi:membrane protein DedA with SNARE-associated domain/rhodanese-related sulfurtransferase